MLHTATQYTNNITKNNYTINNNKIYKLKTQGVNNCSTTKLQFDCVCKLN